MSVAALNSPVLQPVHLRLSLGAFATLYGIEQNLPSEQQGRELSPHWFFLLSVSPESAFLGLGGVAILFGLQFVRGLI